SSSPPAGVRWGWASGPSAWRPPPSSGPPFSCSLVPESKIQNPKSKIDPPASFKLASWFRRVDVKRRSSRVKPLRRCPLDLEERSAHRFREGDRPRAESRAPLRLRRLRGDPLL